MGDFTMPSLGADMETGRLVAWEKRPGDVVRRGDVVAVVETQKGAIEIEVFEDGVLGDPLVAPGEQVPVGTLLARITGEGRIIDAADDINAADTGTVAEPSGIADKAALTAHAPSPIPIPVPDPVPPPLPEPVPPPMPRPGPPQGPEPTRPRASPAARKRAREIGVDLASVAGRGPNGVIELRDVETSTPVESRSPADAMRAAIAAAMARSKREIPHYYLAHETRLDAAARFVSDTNANREPEQRILIGALLLKAVASAARDHPALNGHFVDGRFRPDDSVHVGMAIRLRGGGLVAPGIHDADTLSLDDLMRALRDLVTRVREGRFRATELTSPTLTVSSLGERGVDTLYGVIHPPQVSIVGFGTPRRRAVVDGDAIVAATIASMTLAADHRVSDGHAGARYLADIDHRLQFPETL